MAQANKEKRKCGFCDSDTLTVSPIRSGLSVCNVCYHCASSIAEFSEHYHSDTVALVRAMSRYVNLLVDKIDIEQQDLLREHLDRLANDY